MDLNSLGVGDIQQYVGGLNFPAGKEDVASEAENNGAPQNLVEQIRNAGQDQFNGPQEVLQAVQGGGLL